jgi:hypothetical protein
MDEGRQAMKQSTGPVAGALPRAARPALKLIEGGVPPGRSLADVTRIGDSSLWAPPLPAPGILARTGPASAQDRPGLEAMGTVRFHRAADSAFDRGRR